MSTVDEAFKKLMAGRLGALLLDSKLRLTDAEKNEIIDYLQIMNPEKYNGRQFIFDNLRAKETVQIVIADLIRASTTYMKFLSEKTEQELSFIITQGERLISIVNKDKPDSFTFDEILPYLAGLFGVSQETANILRPIENNHELMKLVEDYWLSASHSLMALVEQKEIEPDFPSFGIPPGTPKAEA